MTDQEMLTAKLIRERVERFFGLKVEPVENTSIGLYASMLAPWKQDEEEPPKK